MSLKSFVDLLYFNQFKYICLICRLSRLLMSWKMAFVVKKCNVMHGTRNRNITSCSYKLGQDKLTAVSHHPYLSVELDDRLNRKEQTERIRSMGVRMLNIIVRRNFTRGTTPTIRCEIYKSLVRPSMEYGSTLGTRINRPESSHSNPSKIMVHDTLTKTQECDNHEERPWLAHDPGKTLG